MNCQEMETIVTDLARNAMVQDQDGALAHVAECSRCSDRISEERRLTDGLLAWSAASIGEQAPPAVEERLRAAFRRRHSRRWMVIAAAGSIAAGLLLFKLAAPPPVVAPAPPKIARVAPAAAAPVVEVAKSTQPVRRRVRRPPPVQAEVATEFLSVAPDDGWTPLDGGRLVRVKLPRSALGAFGVFVDEERRPERINADVMLSNDGVLRAIRFVK